MSCLYIIWHMRRLFTEQLAAWKQNPHRKPLIVRGARQVGKTYLLREFGNVYFPRYHYFNFEKDGALAKIFEPDLNPIRIISELCFRQNSPIDIANDFVIFDEIQACPRALTSLKYFNEDLPALALATAGSLLGIHLGATSYPVGKVDMLTMHPMSFEEFILATKDLRHIEAMQTLKVAMTGREENKPAEPLPSIIHDSLWEQLKIYFIIGGLPEVIKSYLEKRENLFEALDTAREKQLQLVIAYNADMAKHSGKVNAMHLDRIWKAVPTQLAQSQDGSAHKFVFKDVLPGINRYERLAGGIDWLEAAGLVIKIPITNSAQLPLSAYTKENRFKLLCFDIGILGAMSGLSPRVILDYSYGSYKGYFAENFVAQEFTNSGFNCFSWEEGDAEVEFLLEHEGKPLPIEVKSGWRIKSKSLQSFRQKYHPPYQIIVSANNFSYDSRTDAHHYPLYVAGYIH